MLPEDGEGAAPLPHGSPWGKGPIPTSLLCITSGSKKGSLTQGDIVLGNLST